MRMVGFLVMEKVYYCYQLCYFHYEMVKKMHKCNAMLLHHVPLWVIFLK